MTDEVVRMHVVQALTRAVHPEARRHLRAALDELDPDAPEPLRECEVCGRLGTSGRVADHDCRRGGR